MKKRTKRRIIWGVVALAFILALAAIFKPKTSGPLDGVAKDVFLVKQETVQKRTLKHELLMSGSIKALEEATLFPRVNGKLLKNVLREGDAVKKNQTVSLIERDEVGAVYEPVVVPSTITGVVGRVYLDPGANVTVSTPVALVVNQEKVRVAVDIPERYIGEIYKGQPATLRVDALPGKEFEAKLTIISPVVDSTSRAVAVEFYANNTKGLLKSGMFAKVDITLSEKTNAVSVSKQSVYTDEETNETYVFVPSADGKTAVRRNVKTGFINSNHLEVSEGLSAGEQVLTFTYGLKDGSKIELEK
ncbi:MAG: efflux RND transporter periplasmic adaptor subunit [Spirochaetia bacterium]|uniref:efflux RND transporter periplasmic adaptor subunit n=1 Tax=Candidatus Avelusimicrobium fimicolum TaxID=3416216 RepID=UPI003C9CEE32|nr:efflux RND transporter periplasmic adaptor subunit [Spirochaetia bacterium]